jgi:hypothetical protein
MHEHTTVIAATLRHRLDPTVHVLCLVAASCWSRRETVDEILYRAGQRQHRTMSAETTAEQLAPFGEPPLELCRDRALWLLLSRRITTIIDAVGCSAATQAAAAAFVLPFAEHVRQKEHLVSIATRQAWQAARERCAALPSLDHVDAELAKHVCAGVGAWIAQRVTSASKAIRRGVSFGQRQCAAVVRRRAPLGGAH